MTILLMTAYCKFVLSDSVLCIFFHNMSSNSPIPACQVDPMSNSLCMSSFLPALNDCKAVVCLSLLYQLLVRTSWKFIHLFRRHLLHSSSSNSNSPFVSCTWAWTFSFIWICFLTDLDKEYRQSPDRYSFYNVTDVVLNRPLKGSLSCWL